MKTLITLILLTINTLLCMGQKVGIEISQFRKIPTTNYSLSVEENNMFFSVGSNFNFTKKDGVLRDSNVRTIFTNFGYNFELTKNIQALPFIGFGNITDIGKVMNHYSLTFFDLGTSIQLTIHRVHISLGTSIQQKIIIGVYYTIKSKE